MLRENIKVVITILLLALSSIDAQASITVNASGEGWCSSGGYCNNTNTNVLANYFAGDISQVGTLGMDRDWFAFNMPSMANNITSASISIWNWSGNAGSNTLSSAVFNLYEASSITWAGLTNGPSLGNILVSLADNGVSQFVTINLSSSAIASLEAAQGGLFIFGGNDDNSSNDGIFGNNTNVFQAAYLTLNTAAVPEPESYAMLLSGLCLVGYAARNKKQKTA